VVGTGLVATAIRCGGRQAASVAAFAVDDARNCELRVAGPLLSEPALAA
jgi:hypothetical protein